MGKHTKSGLSPCPGAEAAGHTARAHAFQAAVLAGLGAFEPFGSSGCQQGTPA